MEKSKDINSFCRLCLTENLQEPHHIFDEGISNKIIILTQLDVKVSDSLPKFICKECRYQIESSHRMRIVAKQSDTKLRKHIRLINQNKPSNVLSKDYRDDDIDEYDESLVESTRYFAKVEEEISQLRATFEAEKEQIIQKEVNEALKKETKSTQKRKSNRTIIPQNPVVLNKLAPRTENAIVIEEFQESDTQSMVIGNFEIVLMKDNDQLKNNQEDNNPIEYEVVELEQSPLPLKPRSKTYSETTYCRAIEDVENAELDANGEKKIFQCTFEDCEEKFARRQSCKTHFYNHVTKQIVSSGFACKFCGKTFKVISALQRHERVHSGDRPFKCDFKGCTKAFAQKEMLKRHSLIHQPMKDAPFKCSFCKRGFRQSAPLNAHIVKDHSEDSQASVHVCSICQKTFAHSSGLSRHLLLHSGKQFTCEKCGKSFNDQTALKRHENTHSKSKS